MSCLGENISTLDVQGFKGNNNKFIAKEVAVTFGSDAEYQNFIIKPPFEFKKLDFIYQKQAKWLTKNHHGFHWKDGSITFSTVRAFLCKNLKHSEIYVKGIEKKTWIENILNKEVYNLEDLTCPNFQQLYETITTPRLCSAHNGICALRNALVIRKFLDHKMKNSL